MDTTRKCSYTHVHDPHDWWGVDINIGEVRFHCVGRSK